MTHVQGLKVKDHMVNVHQSPKYPQHIGNRGRIIQRRCQNFDGSSGIAVSACAYCVVQSWS